jgi:hypothetical protein
MVTLSIVISAARAFVMTGDWVSGVAVGLAEVIGETIEDGVSVEVGVGVAVMPAPSAMNVPAAVVSFPQTSLTVKMYSYDVPGFTSNTTAHAVTPGRHEEYSLL